MSSLISPGEVILENRTPDHTYELGRITVSGEAAGEAAAAFNDLRVDPELSAERERIQADMEREPDKTLAFVSQMPILYGGEAEEASSYVCPMHPEVTDTEPSSCPKCGMKLVPDQSAPTSYVCPMHPEVTASEQATCPEVRDEAGCRRLSPSRPPMRARCIPRSPTAKRRAVPSAG